MKYALILLSLILMPIASFAQEFPFPKENYADSAVFAQALQELAKQIQDSVTYSNTEVSVTSKMDLSLMAGRYEEVLPYLDSMRQAYEADFRPGMFIPFEVYAHSKALQEQSANGSFQEVFKTRFQEAYSAINTASKEMADRYAQTTTDNLKLILESWKNNFKGSDSLNLENALALINIHNFYQVYSETSHMMQKVVTDYNANTYDIQTRVIETKDGNKIQAYVVRKKSLTGKLPTVFIFNIYADSLGDIGRAKYYAAEGYAGVVANTRGKILSDHELDPFEFDGKDAYELIDWISKQHWSNGKVGMEGGSYLGFAQWAALKNIHPALKTVIPKVSVGPGIDYPMNGNVFMSYMLRWIHYVTNNRTTDYAEFSNTDRWNVLFKSWYEKGSAFNSLDSLDNRPNAIFQRWLEHPSYDAFWYDMVPYQEEFSKIDIPILTTTGYFDDDQMGALYYYKQHHLHNPNANHYLVIGPYDHGGAQMYPTKEVGGYQVDSVATSFNFRNLSVAWFDHILKGKAKPTLLKDKVNYQVMEANEWQHSSTLNNISNDTLTFYFNHTQAGGHYTLSNEPNDGYLAQEVDLADRSDAEVFEFNVIKGSISQDISTSMAFISEPFKEPITITGSFVSQLEVAINKKDFDVVIKAYELKPDGTYFSLFSESGFSALQRASYAKDRTQRQLLSPNQKETVDISTYYFMAKKLSQGSRLVVALGVNKNPYWQVNYGTGKDVSQETIEDALEPLLIKWYSNSHIKFPVLKMD